MTSVMQGVRVLEVAEHGFVPGAAALLSDWGAEVAKIEPVGRGDAARGLPTAGTGGVQVLFEHANRGKQSLALDLSSPDGRDILYRLARDADVFLTNKAPRVRRKLQIDVDDLRAHNPDLIYVRGTGQGERGPEADRGAYDLLTFWHRSGTSSAVAATDGSIPFLPAPGFGDFIGSMFIAGGVMGALYHRQCTGEAPIVDASLLATGMWSMGVAIANGAIDPNWSWPPVIANPLSGTYCTADDRWLALSCLQAGHYWTPLCEVIDRPALAADERFADHASLLANGDAARDALREVFCQRPLGEWTDRFATFSGQWAVVQTTREAAADPQAQANGYLQQCATATGVPYTLVAAPVQFDGMPAQPRRAPQYNEHCNAILESVGLSWDDIVDLKLRGVVA